MSKTKITPLGFGAVLYEIEDAGVNFDEHGRVIRQKKSTPVRPRAKKPTHKRTRRHGRRP